MEHLSPWPAYARITPESENSIPGVAELRVTHARIRFHVGKCSVALSISVKISKPHICLRHELGTEIGFFRCGLVRMDTFIVLSFCQVGKGTNGSFLHYLTLFEKNTPTSNEPQLRG
jgi:hypothetical protein